MSCVDRVGIVAAVMGYPPGMDGFILDSERFADLETGRFFMRVQFTGGGDAVPADTALLAEGFAPIDDRFALDLTLTAAADRQKMVIAVSKASHCLNDLLHRQRARVLHHLPVDDANRPAQERAILDVMGEAQASHLVLARYMQMLSPTLTSALTGRCIDIRHSFLPDFTGAQHYHRAHARGVKLIGATAHVVTADLDEGPIIDQAVERVDHRASVDDVIRNGREMEAQVLARAVGWVGERRVLVDGNRTAMFR